MYDMYPWNDPDSGANRHQDEPAAWLPAPREVPADPAGSAVQAVQVALDRRDNGGDALAVADPPATLPPATLPPATLPPATLPPATLPPARRPAARPTAGRTRQ